MDKRDIDAIYNLMQNVSDKLDGILKTMHLKEEKKDDSRLDKLLENQEGTKNFLTHLKKNLDEKLNDSGSTVTNHKSYTLFGKGSKMDSRLLYFFATLIFIVWIAFKYLSPIILEQDRIRLENETYRTMHDYLYLKDLRDEEPNISIGLLMKQIQTKNAKFTEEFNEMLIEHERTKRRIELENELNTLK